jgi:hypothetical protein
MILLAANDGQPVACRVKTKQSSFRESYFRYSFFLSVGKGMNVDDSSICQ